MNRTSIACTMTLSGIVMIMRDGRRGAMSSRQWFSSSTILSLQRERRAASEYAACIHLTPMSNMPTIRHLCIIFSLVALPINRPPHPRHPSQAEPVKNGKSIILPKSSYYPLCRYAVVPEIRRSVYFGFHCRYILRTLRAHVDAQTSK